MESVQESTINTLNMGKHSRNQITAMNISLTHSLPGQTYVKILHYLSCADFESWAKITKT